MTPFEEQLKQAMERREPAADFTQRVLARVKQKQPRNCENGPKAWFRAWRMWRWAGVMAALLVISGSVIYQQHERAVRGEAAKEKLLTAVRIAGVKLHEVHRHVLEVQATEVNQ